MGFDGIEQQARGDVVMPEPLGDWTLVGCTVSPGFLFSSFEMAPAGWEPGA